LIEGEVGVEEVGRSGGRRGKGGGRRGRGGGRG